MYNYIFLVFFLLVFSCKNQKNLTSQNQDLEKSQENSTQTQNLLQEKRFYGHFQYMADAAIFYPCGGGKHYPVSMEGEYLKTEQAYLNTIIDGGEKIFVELIGDTLPRPSMEEGHTVISLVIDQLIELQMYRDCEEK